MAILQVLLAGECRGKLVPLAQDLAKLGYDTTAAEGRLATMQQLFADIYDVVVLDETVLQADCPRWLRHIALLSPQSQVIRLTPCPTDGLSAYPCFSPVDLVTQLPCPVSAEQLSRAILDACTCGTAALPILPSS
ncbi:hypothetical protein LN040_14490 [Desulfovibrio subterraneus]|uniref:hypothetical protein n=1 Tax=Desulfovibrio subterraneus TaxID=2718620 RepID=UPI0022B873AA|nr:hypothetical protein [Desulfovibrio subterraneus]WBF66916.1 hypothetical protein LN040_14490 [Desulfovibrio subterraneus]